MASITPDPHKRGYDLPSGYKDLVDLLKLKGRPRVNGRIRARRIQVYDELGKTLGVHSLAEALTMARNLGVDLIEVDAAASPPGCLLIDYGKYRYQKAKLGRKDARA
jgi:translation initiation factor IF-3